MTGRKVSCGRHAHVAGARTARIRSVSSPMDLTHGIAHVHEGVALAGDDLVDEVLAAGHHLIQHQRQVAVVELALAGRRAQHWRETDAVEAKLDELVERAGQVQVDRGHGYPRRYLHTVLAG